MKKEDLREERLTEMPTVNPETAMFPISVIAKHFTGTPENTQDLR